MLVDEFRNKGWGSGFGLLNSSPEARGQGRSEESDLQPRLLLVDVLQQDREGTQKKEGMWFRNRKSMRKKNKGNAWPNCARRPMDDREEDSQSSADRITVPWIHRGGQNRFTVIRREITPSWINNNPGMDSVFRALTTVNLLLSYPVYGNTIFKRELTTFREKNEIHNLQSDLLSN